MRGGECVYVHVGFLARRHCSVSIGESVGSLDPNKRVFRWHRARDAAVGVRVTPVETWVRQADSPYAQDLRSDSYIPSLASDFSPCSCPLCVSSPGHAVSY